MLNAKCASNVNRPNSTSDCVLCSFIFKKLRIYIHATFYYQ